MTKFTLFIALMLTVKALPQASDSTKTEVGKHGNLVSYLYELEQIRGIDNIKHVDTLLDYKINIPLWWKIKETPTVRMFGGTFPAVNGVENALLLKSFEKAKFKDKQDFEDWVIGSYKIGDIPEWSDSHTLLLKKQIRDFKNLGTAYFVQLINGGKIYHCCYIVVETSKTYLWIDFTATAETYELNFVKLKDLLKDFHII